MKQTNSIDFKKVEKNDFLKMYGSPGKLKVLKVIQDGEKIITLYEKNGVLFGVRI